MGASRPSATGDRELRTSLVAAQLYSDDFDIQRPDGSVRRPHVAGRPSPALAVNPGASAALPWM
ncbi:hypothetical protein ACVGVM_23605 [Pseudonocardia bannensis]|uniref:Uncharacterized protein n=1 Tax=Pseudonocardia bannensis TaxID=630973 RepID=A0A848DT56_9PSEU|nr:hypothetical protein [Pseudonocardia bannensis]NMH95693.1 hypothetical protein [Pseudonocardia bannensis]